MLKYVTLFTLIGGAAFAQQAAPSMQAQFAAELARSLSQTMAVVDGQAKQIAELQAQIADLKKSDAPKSAPDAVPAK